MSDVVLSLRGIAKSYGSVQAIRNVDLDIHAGEVLALMGDNGAGKSTLMNIACGNIAADRGEIRVMDELLANPSVRGAQALGVDVVYQDLALAPSLSVLENVYLGHEIARAGLLGRVGWLHRSRMAKGAANNIRELGVDLPSMNALVSKLSGGQRQAVAIARAVMWARNVLLLDEPTAALGVKQSNIVEEVIRKTAEKGLGVLLVSHDVPGVLRIADRVAVLYQGRIALLEPASGLTLERIVAAMVGRIDDAA